MPLPVVADTYRIVCEFSGGASSKNWSTHFDYEADTPGSTAADLWAAFEPAFMAFEAYTPLSTSEEVRDAFTTDTDWLSATVFPLDGSSVGVVNTPAVSAFGTASSAQTLPPDLAVVASLRTTERGPRGRGRQYWQANAAVINSNGLVLTWFRTNLAVGLFTELLAIAGSLANYNLVVVGRQSPGSSTHVARPVVNIAVDQHFDVQRRRGLA